MGAGFGRVEKQATAGNGVVNALGETVGLGVFGEHAKKGRAIIVIADAQPHRNREIIQSGAQPFIVRPIAPIGKIACDHHQFGIAVVGKDMP